MSPVAIAAITTASGISPKRAVLALTINPLPGWAVSRSNQASQRSSTEVAIAAGSATGRFIRSPHAVTAKQLARTTSNPVQVSVQCPTV